MTSFSKLREKKSKDDPCWDGYTQVGMKKKNGKEVPNCVPSKGVEKAKGYKKEDTDLEEKAVSKAQQKFMGMVRAKQKGEMDDASPEVTKAAKSMSKKDVEDFAKTKHKDLPTKKEPVDEADSWKKDSGWRKAQKMRKDRYGNTVKDKNVAKNLAKSAQKKTAGMDK